MALSKVILVLGPPGSGKGTQGKLLANVNKFAYFSMGQTLREYSKRETDLAKKIKKLIDGGYLIEDHLIREVLLEEVEKFKDREGLIIDGFPRHDSQIPTLDELLQKYSIKELKIIFLDVPEKELRERIAARSTGSARADDDPNIIDTRMEEYKTRSLPLKDYFEKRHELVIVDGRHSIEEVHQEILTKLDYA